MILKTLMEEKQLDFNQPLMSVRRFTSTVASELENKVEANSSRTKLLPIPVYKSELKSGPIRNPGTVPFVWEQAPGRPKDERKPQTQVPERQSGAPKLPTGRIVKHENCEKSRKNASATQSSKENVLSDSKQDKSVNDCSIKDEVLKLVKEERLSSGSDDGDEAYVDALDTLSKAESFFMSCCVSVVSELEEIDSKPPGTLSIDPQTRDLMMGRFLPAAKALAAKTPHHAPRKAPVVQEQPRQLRKLVIKEKQQIPYSKRTTALPRYVQAIVAEDTDDDKEDGYDKTGDYASKLCGLFPTFCLLNPIPGMGMQERMPLSSFHGLQAKTTVASYRGSRKGRARNVSCQEKSVIGSTKIVCGKDDSKVGNESSRCKLQGNGVSASQKVNIHREEEASHGPPYKCKHSDVKNMNPHGTRYRALHELLAKECNSLDSDSGGPAVVDKTLCINAVHRFKSSSSANAIEMEGRILEKGSGFEPAIKGNKSEEDPASLEFSLEVNDKNSTRMDEKETLHSRSSQSLDSCFLSFADTANFKVIDDSRCDRNLLQDSTTLRSSERVENRDENHGPIRPDDHGRCHASVHDCTAWASSKLPCDGKIQLERKLDHLPLALPLPKAPSESWLMRTLPAVSSRNVSSRSALAVQVSSRIQTKGACDPECETMIKSSNTHYSTLGLSEEKLSPIPET